ncbi:MAG: NUDIX hydrolase [Oscillospiraceae bacterium]|jgi:ADP-ribose pyrophosphatase|nr:NUDIX hydrolase [Oscillospiraceae bacterium]
MNLEETTVNSALVYDGKVVKLFLDDVLIQNGEKVKRERIIHPGGVGILALTDEGDILLVKQFRYGAMQVIDEIPAGKLEPFEDPEECGRRELYEETGYKAASFEKLLELYPTPAYDSEKIYVYFASQLTKIDDETHLDDDEFLENIAVPAEEALRRIIKGEITDAKTVAAVMKAKLLGKF